MLGVRTSVKVNYKGNELTLYYISAMCQATGRKAQTLRKWELAGVIPRTPFRDKTNKRLYLKEHIDDVASCLESCGVVQGRNIDNTSFKPKVYKLFNEINKKYEIAPLANRGEV